MEPLSVPHLRPTALQQMRGFLAQFGAELPPWSSSDEVMDLLAALLNDHRDDDAFFARLTPFLEELRDNAARGLVGLPARDAELLSRATVDSLVAELREGLTKAPSGAAPSMIRSLLGERAAPLLCLALISAGLTACTPKTEPNSPGEPGTPSASSAPAAWGGPAPAEPGTPPPAAQPKPIEGSPDALVEVFKTKTPEEAAKALEQILDAGNPMPDAAAAKPAQKARPTIDPMSVTLYKGVILS